MYNIGTKQQIYQTAKHLFYYEGYQVGSRKIASEASVNQGLITYYFKSKKNIAMMILKENYEIISIYLRYFVDPNRDVLLFTLSFINTMDKICDLDANYRRLILQLSEENILEESIIHAENQTKNFYKMIHTYLPFDQNSERTFYILVDLIYGATRNLLYRINTSIDFSYDDYFEVIVKIFLMILDLPNKEQDVRNLIDRSNEVLINMFQQYPNLTKPETFMFQGEIPVE